MGKEQTNELLQFNFNVYQNMNNSGGPFPSVSKRVFYKEVQSPNFFEGKYQSPLKGVSKMLKKP